MPIEQALTRRRPAGPAGDRGRRDARAGYDDVVALWEAQPRVAFREAVRRHLRRALRSGCAGDGITCLSGWASRATIEELVRRPGPGLPAPPGGIAGPDDLDDGVDLGAGAPCAGVFVALGSLAASPGGDPGAVVRDIRRRCSPRAVVVWSHNLLWPGPAQQVRSLFAELFDTIDVDLVGADPERGQSWYVGSAWTYAEAG